MKSAFDTIHDAKPRQNGKDTLQELHDEFLAEQRYGTRLADATLAAYRTSFELLAALVPGLAPGQLTPAVLTEFFRRLDTRVRLVGRREQRGVTTSTIASHRSRLGRFFSWLRQRGAIATNPFESMPYPRVEYERRQYLERTDVERIFAALVLAVSGRARFHRARNLALFATLLYTGVRRGELLGLRLTDLSLERFELIVRAETSKSRRMRVVPLNAELRRALEDYLSERRQLPLRCNRLFVSEAGEPLTVAGLKHLVKAIVRRSGVRFHLHQFRHTFAVNVLHRGGDVAKLKQLLGHQDIRMTSGYLRALPTHAMRDSVEGVTLDRLL